MPPEIQPPIKFNALRDTGGYVLRAPALREWFGLPPHLDDATIVSALARALIKPAASM